MSCKNRDKCEMFAQTRKIKVQFIRSTLQRCQEHIQTSIRTYFMKFFLNPKLNSDSDSCQAVVDSGAKIDLTKGSPINGKMKVKTDASNHEFRINFIFQCLMWLLCPFFQLVNYTKKIYTHLQ